MSYLVNLSRSPRLMALAACGAIMATIPINPAFAAPSNESTYQNSCQNINVAGATLLASCRRIDGGFNQTSILIRGIENINGVLSYSSDLSSASSYQNSCQSISVAGATLTASCRRIDGTFNQTSILIRGIENINGFLTYS